jgi:hypothetical protein
LSGTIDFQQPPPELERVSLVIDGGEDVGSLHDRAVEADFGNRDQGLPADFDWVSGPDKNGEEAQSGFAAELFDGQEGFLPHGGIPGGGELREPVQRAIHFPGTGQPGGGGLYLRMLRHQKTENGVAIGRRRAGG